MQRASHGAAEELRNGVVQYYRLQYAAHRHPVLLRPGAGESWAIFPLAVLLSSDADYDAAV